MDIASSMSNLEENLILDNALKLLKCRKESRVHPKYPLKLLRPATYNGLCLQLLLLPQSPPATRNWWGYDVLLSLIAILFNLSPPMRNLDKICVSSGTKMLRECINRTNVEPPTTICNFILYHPCDDVLADSNCGNLLQAAWGGNFLQQPSYIGEYPVT